MFKYYEFVLRVACFVGPLGGLLSQCNVRKKNGHAVDEMMSRDGGGPETVQLVQLALRSRPPTAGVTWSSSEAFMPGGEPLYGAAMTYTSKRCLHSQDFNNKRYVYSYDVHRTIVTYTKDM